jgi:hypothetical protein
MTLERPVFLLQHPQDRIKGCIVLLILLLVFMLFFVYPFYQAYPSFREIFIIRPAIESSGVSTTATYTHRYIRLFGEDGFFYCFSYRYTVASRFYQGEHCSINVHLHYSIVGSTVQIQYAADKPHLSIAVDEASELPLHDYVMVMGTSTWFVIAGFVFWISMLKDLWASLMLNRQAKAVGGELLEVSGATGQDDIGLPQYIIKIRYSFIEPQTGEYIEGQAQAIRNDLAMQPLPAVGTRLAIQYWNKDNYQVL